MGNSLRIGVVGCGAMGRQHLSIWKNTPGATVTAVCDPNHEVAVSAAEPFGAKAFADLETLLDSGLIDAVDLITPSGLHADQSLKAVQKGIHVLCEKPLDLSLEKIDRLLEAAEAENITVACVFQRRAYPAAQKVAAAVHDGRFGKLVSCSAATKWWRSQEYYNSADWRGTWALDGGVLANQAIHAIDHLCWLAGSVEEVEYARIDTLSHDMEADDNALAIVRFSSGARGVIEATTCCNPPLASRIEVYGTNGSAAFDDATPVSFGIGGEDLLSTVQDDTGAIGGQADPMAISLRGHSIIAADLVEAIQTGRTPMVPISAARVSVEALVKIYQAARPGLNLGT